ncbi:Eco57I restriction-modification methylase domain-containing protein [Bradyrhizobium sp. 1050_B9_N1_2]|uniref:Eco57I restriction-modification methylase domain-containing protein n=1 Tax=Bradyrhizobium sp. 1050_B9_N1_2 TaxID=3238688 RepID=UPI003EDB6E00
MAPHLKRAADIGLAAINVEGGLISPEKLAEIAATTPDAKAAADYHCPKGTSLRDEITRYFRIGQAHWQAWLRIERPTVTQTAAFSKSLLQEAFGFEALKGPSDHIADGHRYRIAWEAKGGRVPIVVAAPIGSDNGKTVEAFTKALPEFGDGHTEGLARRSPVALLQDWLNTSHESNWGLVFAGDRIRLMRDNASFTRAAYIEADLGAIFRDEMFADFTAIWLLIHASRFGAEGAPAGESPLEKWREAGQRAGTAARERLRGSVEDTLLALGQGFLDANPDLRTRLDDQSLTMQAWFEQLLRVVYRLIFLAVAEDRELLLSPSTNPAVRSLYVDGYGFAHLRERSIRRSAHDHHSDAWEGAKVVFRALERGEKLLGLPALGGLFATGLTPDLDDTKLPNRAFMAAIFKLSWLMDDNRRVRINWRDMATEELGSVYEGLLELVPVREDYGRTFTFAGGAEARGNARKISGSYYTPDSLVQTLLNSALDPVLDQAEAGGGADAILSLNVIDPACGSGHFLLGAARRMATRVAQLRDNDAPDYPAAMRDVARNCIHGVDRNPMAVELAKVALWIETVEPGKPLGFLDANIQCGDSLLGVLDLGALEEGIPDDAYKPLTGDDKKTAKWFVKRNKAEKVGQGSFDWARGGGGLPPAKLAAEMDDLRHLPEDTVEQVEAKRERFAAWRNDPKRWATKVACDLFIAAFLLPKKGGVPTDTNGVTIPTTAHIRTRLNGGSLYGPLETAAIDAADYARAFHWPLAFPEVMIARGGFDVVLGNPPWERIKLQEQEFFANRSPDIALAPTTAARGKLIRQLAEAAPGSPARLLHDQFEFAKRVAEAASVFFTAPKDKDPTKIDLIKVGHARRYPWTGRGDVNTYALFAEHFVNLTSKAGRAGLIVPTGIATDATTAPFFDHLTKSKRLISLFSFFEVRKWFHATDDRKAFCLLTLGRTNKPTQFMFEISELDDLGTGERLFELTSEQIEALNPNTKTVAIFRTKADAQLAAKIYERVPVLKEEAKGTAGNPWGVSFMTIFHMSKDSGMFQIAEQLRDAGFVRRGSDWMSAAGFLRAARELVPLTAGRDVNGVGVSVDSARTTQRYVPLYEAKMIHQFDHRWASYEGSESRELTLGEKVNPQFEVTPRYWVPEAEVEDRLQEREWRYSWLALFRGIGRATDERTFISTIIPRCGSGNSGPVILFRSAGPRQIAAFVANASSLSVDFIMRFKAGGANLNFFIIEQLPIVPPSAYSERDLSFIQPRVLELCYTSQSMAPFARDLGYEGPPFEWNENRRAELRADLDGWYALAYGLSRDELRYVLDPKEAMGADYPGETFRVLQKNEIAKYGEYRTARLVMAAYDRLVSEGMPPRTEGYR